VTFNDRIRRAGRRAARQHHELTGISSHRIRVQQDAVAPVEHGRRRTNPERQRADARQVYPGTSSDGPDHNPKLGAEQGGVWDGTHWFSPGIERDTLLSI
jgi:hypothetical protein